MNTAIGVLVVIGLLTSLVSMWQNLKLRRRLNSALSDSTGRSLEATLARYLQRVQAAENQLEALQSAHDRLAVQAGLASQKISVVRFNPFGDTGGDQSFALAVLDAHNSGYVMTSIHGREGTRIYVKPIDYGKSKYTLSREEQQAMEQASKRVAK